MKTKLSEEVIVSLLKTGAYLQRHLERFFKNYGLTRQQYNVLRILNASELKSKTCLLIRERLLEPQPDITRLLDRMEAQKLIRKIPGKDDKRQVVIRLTSSGEKKINEIQPHLLNLLDEMSKPMSAGDLKDVLRVLEKFKF